MAREKWIVLPGGRIKRWKKSESEWRCRFSRMVPPHWYCNHLNRRERNAKRHYIKAKQRLITLFTPPRQVGIGKK